MQSLQKPNLPKEITDALDKVIKSLLDLVVASYKAGTSDQEKIMLGILREELDNERSSKSASEPSS